MSTLKSPIDEWCYATGLFMLNFGTFDFAVFEFLEAKLAVAEFEKLKERPLSDRLDYIERLFASDSARLGLFRALRQRLDPYRLLRNHIAHGHLLLRVGFPDEKPTMAIALAKTQSPLLDPAGCVANPAALMNWANEVGALGEEFRQFLVSGIS